MSTQIFISSLSEPCKPEFTKIAAHSLSFATEDPENNSVLYFGSSVPIASPFFNFPPAIWSGTVYDTALLLPPSVPGSQEQMGIHLPINLVSEDKVTISGSATSYTAGAYIEQGYDVYLTVGVYYFDCSLATAPFKQAFTFIPVETFQFDQQGKSGLCFETSVTLGSNYDAHETRFLVGFNIYAICNSDPCGEPIADPNLTTVSYTLDIERPCAVITSESNFIIKNCCEPLITELVNIAGLQVGSFHVDDEGNCWEVISASTDVTNFTRNFVDIYTSCVECQAANPCPLNLKIESCCVDGQEFVTGSLPGLEVGDTFVDNNGLCWSVSDTTGGPVSEESITVDTEFMGTCDLCTTSNPCPDFWYIESCCAKISEIIATSVLLDLGDSFVDTNGICWSVVEQVQYLPTNYNIVVDTVYSMTPTPFQDNCEQCIFYNPCPLEYFLTVRACCDNDRIEVIAVPAQYMNLSEGFIFRDQYLICWEVMSYSTTGVETYPLTWGISKLPVFKDCFTCTAGKGGTIVCRTLWQVRDCDTDAIYTAQIINTLVTVGSFYYGQLNTGGLGVFSCFEVLGYGYPAVDPLSVFLSQTEYLSCPECSLNINDQKILELEPCCGEPNIIINFYGTWSNGIGSVQSLNIYDNSGVYIMTQCYTLIAISSGAPVNPVAWTIDARYIDCVTCTNKHDCV